jgi:CrcB protein
MKNILLVMLGGGLGAACRYGVSLATARWFGSGFPWGTLIVNLAGCLLIGLVFGMTARGTTHPAERLFFVTGFLGALTTFSTFALETTQAMPGSFHLAGLNILANNVAGLVLAAGGMWLGSKL